MILLMLVEFITGNNNQDLHVHTLDGNRTGRKKELPRGHAAKNASMKGFRDLYRLHLVNVLRHNVKLVELSVVVCTNQWKQQIRRRY